MYKLMKHNTSMQNSVDTVKLNDSFSVYVSIWCLYPQDRPPPPSPLLVLDNHPGIHRLVFRTEGGPELDPDPTRA